MTAKPAGKGRTYICMSCGFRRQVLGALINHVRQAHDRKLSAPEYESITERQATAISANIHRIVIDDR